MPIRAFKKGAFMSKNSNSGKILGGGIGFGSCLAMVISYTAWKSVGWAIIHGILGWFYVIYYVLVY